MIRPRLLFLLFLACGSNLPANHTSSIEFVPNPATLSGGVCAAKGRILEISGTTVSLVSVTAVFSDTAGGSAQFVLDANQFSSILDSEVVPPYGIATASFSFDLGSKGLTVPSDGSVIAVGVGEGGGVTHFIGTLHCEGAL